MNNTKIKKEQFDMAQKKFLQATFSDSQKKAMLAHIYSTDLSNYGASVPNNGAKLSDSEIVKRSHEYKHPVASPFWVFSRQKVLVATIVVIMFLSGTAYASAQSLPGDMLYKIKTDVLEPIALFVRFDEKSKNEYRAFLAQKRIDELMELEKREMSKSDAEKNGTDESVDESTIDVDLEIDLEKNPPIKLPQPIDVQQPIDRKSVV